MSVAVACASQSGPVLLEYEAAGGALASTGLIPAIQGLLAQAGLALGQLDAIAFGCGPGSFTGLRTACSVAQGLAFGVGVPVLPVETLMAVAQEAHTRHGANRVVAVLDARMDEVYWASYCLEGGNWRRQGAVALGRPEALVLEPGWVLAGNAFAAYGTRLPQGLQLPVLPTAAALLQVAPALLAAGLAGPAVQALPLYIRDKVAQTTQERAALRASTQP